MPDEVEFNRAKYSIGCDPAHPEAFVEVTEYWVEITRSDGTTYAAKRLACGCVGECDPYAHDTAWDWDGTPDAPAWDDLSPAEQYAERRRRFDEWMRSEYK